LEKTIGVQEKNNAVFSICPLEDIVLKKCDLID